ncbi:VanZ family protein [Tamilnaduibacter salinus]|uniref:Teicoplanin resistance protein VanZ n=1 Tax=Tamilnaduibacter salinus TaxID=1484056 RepID=A0A2A2I2A8_9GAMM|nr:VanZ family protein [Tamilnaduibacter salinus]PAV25558.1 teicoplanin resistance protein VanZ [Tamilnaduibacter salinus]PVY76318.1 VanZ family protein [Tamilnaduibacter salinus]
MTTPVPVWLHTLRAQYWLWRLGLALSVVAILWLATSDLDQSVPSTGWDKANHLIAFLELTILTRLGWPRLPLPVIALSLTGYGALIEAVQSTLPYREFSLLDLAADMTGIALGLIHWPKR